MNFRKLLFVTLAMIYVFTGFAGNDEGMWLPLYIKQLNEKKMQEMGMKLTADDIYSINHASIKDAILRLGTGFCTGELVSENGLVFTNHHCGYDAIAELSSVKDNFLENGFWASGYEKEIPIPGFTVSRLVSMRDVTKFIKDATKGVEEPDLKGRISQVSDSLVKSAVYDTHFEAEVKSYFGDNEFYLLVYETFRDVRFVAAPPASIGKFGGDTDNWMWPRHTCDFSVLRVYTGPDGRPADYNVDNVPYKPIKYFPISLKGIKENDFAMILGYPAETERYLSSYDIDFKQNIEQPTVIKIFGDALRIMKTDMDKDPQVNLSFASDYASLNNTYKYYVGQNLGLKKQGLVANYVEQENAFNNWLNADPQRKAGYGELLPGLEKSYKRFRSISPGYIYMGYGIFRLNMFNHVYNISKLLDDIAAKKPEGDIRLSVLEQQKQSNSFFDKKYLPTEKKVLQSLLIMYYYSEVNPDENAFFKEIMLKTKGKTPEEKINTYLEKLYSKSILFDQAKLAKFFEQPNEKMLKNDPAIKMINDLIDVYRNNYMMTYMSVSNTIDNYHGKYIAALREWKSDRIFYPDANSSMRMTYGKVIPYFPKDGIYYDYRTTYLGILQKENPNDEEFKVPAKLHDLLIRKDFGRYAQNDTLYTCFLTDNDISGGNSGSPVINGEGQLIGIAFDGNWEAMTGDLVVNPKFNRTINVDIRYVLFMIEKFGGATRLINELKIIE